MRDLDWVVQTSHCIFSPRRSRAPVIPYAATVVGFSFVLFTVCIFSDGIATAQVVSTQGQAIDSYLQKLSGFGYSGVVLVSVDGKIVLRKGYGYADREKHIQIQPETRFDIGSLSKNFTAAAVLRLETDGNLRVEDPISKFLTDLPDDKRSVTIHQLLTHTAGVTGPEHGYRVIAKKKAIQEILSTPLKFKPGTDWAYSNAGFVLLAAIIESASGQPYQEYMTQHIFRPAGLTSTGFWGRRLPPGSSRLLAKGYDELGVVADMDKLSGDTWNDMGSGQIVSTVDDLYRWQQSLEQNRVIPAAELKKMLTPVMREEPSENYFTKSYGYGIWAQTLPDGSHRFYHGGEFLGFSSELIWLPERKTVITALCNVRKELYPVHRRADRAIPEMLAGKKVPEVPSFVKLPTSDWNRLLGTYRLPTGGEFTLYRSPEGFAVGANGQDATILLDGNFEQEGRLDARNQASVTLLSSLLRGDNSGLAALGLGDAQAQDDIRHEVYSLSNGRGSFKEVHAVGTYIGGLLGKFDETILKAEFENGAAYYRIQWGGKDVAGTDVRCPHLAASTLVQLKSKHVLIGWNIITLKEFEVQVVPTFRSITVLSSGRRATADRLP